MPTLSPRYRSMVCASGLKPPLSRTTASMPARSNAIAIVMPAAPPPITHTAQVTWRPSSSWRASMNMVPFLQGQAGCARGGSQPPDAQARGLQRARVERGLHVDHAAALDDLAAQVLARERAVAAMRHGHHQGLRARQVAPLHQAHAVFVPGLLGVGLG